MDCSGDASFNNLIARKNLNVIGTMDCSGDTSFNNVFLRKNLSVLGTMDCSGDASFNNVFLRKNLNVIGTMDCSGDVTAKVYGLKDPSNGDITRGGIYFRDNVLNIDSGNQDSLSQQMIPPPTDFSSNNFTVTGQTGSNAFKNGTYAASASSTTPNRLPWYAFNEIPPKFWQSQSAGFYSQHPYNNADPVSEYQGGGTTATFFTTIIDGVGISGEYIQIQLPFQFLLQSYSLKSGPNSVHKKIYVAGSNNGTTWTMLDYQDISVAVASGEKTYTVINNNKYSYFRLVISQVFYYIVAQLTQWKLFGSLSLPLTSNVSSICFRTTKTDGSFNNVLKMYNEFLETDCPDPYFSNSSGILATTRFVTNKINNTTSDYRLKQHVQSIDTSDTVLNLNPQKYFKNDKLEYGFLAHEVQEMFPTLVTGEKDGKEMQTLNYLGLISILVKDVQRLHKKIDELENIILKKNEI